MVACENDISLEKFTWLKDQRLLGLPQLMVYVGEVHLQVMASGLKVHILFKAEFKIVHLDSWLKFYPFENCWHQWIEYHQWLATGIPRWIQVGTNALCVFLADLAALYLTLRHSVSQCHFRILTQGVTFETWDPSDILSEWCLDIKTKRQKN